VRNEEAERIGGGKGLVITDGVGIDDRRRQRLPVPTKKSVALDTSRAEERKGKRRGDLGLFIAGSNLQRGLGLGEIDRVAGRGTVLGVESLPKVGDDGCGRAVSCWGEEREPDEQGPCISGRKGAARYHFGTELIGPRADSEAGPLRSPAAFFIFFISFPFSVSDFWFI
jgi:hypothetical protein